MLLKLTAYILCCGSGLVDWIVVELKIPCLGESPFTIL